jgi:hypothetical protein
MALIGSLFLITSLAEDVKLSACGRHPSLCLLPFFFYFLVKFREAFFYVVPKLTYPLG